MRYFGILGDHFGILKLSILEYGILVGINFGMRDIAYLPSPTKKSLTIEYRAALQKKQQQN